MVKAAPEIVKIVKGETPDFGTNPYGLPSHEDGDINMPYFMWQFHRYYTYQEECNRAGVKCPLDIAKLQKQTRETMIMLGFDTDDVRLSKGSSMVWDVSDSLLEKSERELSQIEEGCGLIINGVFNHSLQLYQSGYNLTSTQKKRVERFLKLVKRVQRLQSFCRDKVPSRSVCYALSDRTIKMDSRCDMPMEWSRPIRLMLYVRRSDTPGWPDVMDPATHLQRACIEYGVAKWQGSAGVAIGMCPGHGKTVLGMCLLANELIDNHDLCCGVLHYKDDEASARLENIKEMMRPNNPMGRRFLALFPEIRVQTKKCNSSQFYIKRESGGKDPTLESSGINSGGQGKDRHRIWGDDIVDEKERYEETQRDATHRRFTGTWLSRLRGPKTFYFLTYTPWHHDDTYGRLKKTTATFTPRKGVFRVGYERRCHEVVFVEMWAGDASNPYRPMWPRYPEEWYRRRARELGSSTLYNCLYRGIVLTTDDQMIRKLHYVLHDINSEDPEVARLSLEFEAGAFCVLSVDPTATVSKKADKAGILFALVNEELKRIRILDVWEMSINQIVLAEFINDLHNSRKIDWIMVETVGGFHATCDMLEQYHDIPSEMIIRKSTSNRDKGTRLQACAALIEAGNVEFRGRRLDDKIMVGLEEHSWFYEQILKFGVVADDHALDAVTQMIRHFSRDLWGFIKGPEKAEPFAQTESQKRLRAELKPLLYPTHNQPESCGYEYEFDHLMGFEDEEALLC